MLKENMYVRIPWDPENRAEPRNFVCGQISERDDYNKTLKVMVRDPFRYAVFFEDIRTGPVEVSVSKAVHCRFFLGSDVVVDGVRCAVVADAADEDEYYTYYVQNRATKAVFRVSEQNVCASFTDGKADPCAQLRRYEFQNPCWYLGRSIVSSNMNILDNAMYGFRTLAGSKIYLLPHQVNTIMRCLQETPCRYMLADEVGMGKTVEALSVLKIYMEDRTDRRILILVPEPLRKQWKTEMLLKFDISTGAGRNGNLVTVKAYGELAAGEAEESYDFLVADEIHRCLADPDMYGQLHALSRAAENVLLLSATPVQSRDEEYLNLLKLLQPAKYDSYTPEQFREVLGRQNSVVQKTVLVLDDLEELEEERKKALDRGEDPHGSEECQELWEEIRDELETLCGRLRDEKLTDLLETVDFEDEDLGIYQTKIFISYICCGYQVESNIIRNRRRILESEEDGTCLLPRRELRRLSYPLDFDANQAEAVCWENLKDWMGRNAVAAEESVIRTLLGSFFSSPWAFDACLKRLEKDGVRTDPELKESAALWKRREMYLLGRIEKVLDDPEAMENQYLSRLTTVLNCVTQDLYDKRIVLFTEYGETFDAYRKALTALLPAEETAFFRAGTDREELEQSVYRFQNDPACRILLCDSSGGEGHNFQCADFVVHIDLPWEADKIEQRIGRLDRLERDPARNVVTSVVVYAEETFEESLFRFWDEGLKIFTQSLSGMEIIMKDIDREIMDAVRKDFRYGLPDRIPAIIASADRMRQAVIKEQNYDVAGYLYRPMNVQLSNLINYYRENENELFANSMLNWASLAGFFASERTDNGIITFSERSFSGKAAVNSRFLPPVWADYMNDGQIRFLSMVLNSREKKEPSYRDTNRSIRGTFVRKVAIENDFLHFFAPGDAVYDSIVNNAIRSCKGTASAFAVPYSHDWQGFVFTFSMTPDLSRLLENGLSLYAIGPYRSYLATELVMVAVALDNPDGVPDEEILRQVRRTAASWQKGKGYVHLGKRSPARGFLGDRITGRTNIAWFKGNHPPAQWTADLKEARAEAGKKAQAVLKSRSKLTEAKEEMERILSAKTAADLFYGTGDGTAAALKKEQNVILSAMRGSKLRLDSAAFVWMVKETDGYFQT